MGHQLATLAGAVEVWRPGLVWYGGDVDGPALRWFSGFEGTMRRVGSTAELVAMAANDTQFLAGVFVACTGECADLAGMEVSTEDTAPVRATGMVAGIRCYDTAWFEIFAPEKAAIELILWTVVFSIEKDIEPLPG
jgi:hypothetical protein